MTHTFPLLPLALGAILLYAIGHAGDPPPQDPPESPITGSRVAGTLPVPSARHPAATQAQQLLHRAQAALAARRSVTARVSLRINLYDQPMLGTGGYWQDTAASRRLRMDLKIQAGQHIAAVQQVADGKHLWIGRQLYKDGPSTLARVDLDRVLAARQASQPDSLPLLAGGLPHLLDALNHSFLFTAAYQSQVHDRPVYVLRGRWVPARLVRWLPDQRQAIQAGEPPDLTRLPDPLPDQVLLVLGQSDLFPYRIEYRRTPSDPPHSASASSESTRLLVRIDFYDVQFDLPLDDRRFHFQSGDTPVADETSQFIDRLKPPSLPD